MRIRPNLKLPGWGIMLLGLLLYACKSDVVYHSFHSVSSTGWRGSDTLNFIFEKPDSTATYTLTVNLRYHTNFPYMSLPIGLILTTSSDSVLLRDTLCLSIADEQGNQTGTGWGDLYLTSSTAITLPTGLTDSVRLSLLPVLPDSLLPGINDVGVCIKLP